MTITEFISSMPEELTTFFEETDANLTGKGYRCEIKQAKSGPLVSYKKDKKTLLNYVCRKTGVKIRLYAANVGHYEHFLDTLPDKMKTEILKATDCKKLNGLSCSPSCPGGYVFNLDGSIYKNAAAWRFYTKHPLKYGKNQADNLVTVENSFLRISAQIFSRFLLVFSITYVKHRQLRIYNKIY